MYDLVVRRLRWIERDESKLEYVESQSWTDDPKRAYVFVTLYAFSFARHNGGSVYLRLPTGREIPVSESDFQ